MWKSNIYCKVVLCSPFVNVYTIEAKIEGYSFFVLSNAFLYEYGCFF